MQAKGLVWEVREAGAARDCVINYEPLDLPPFYMIALFSFFILLLLVKVMLSICWKKEDLMQNKAK